MNDKPQAATVAVRAEWLGCAPGLARVALFSVTLPASCAPSCR